MDRIIGYIFKILFALIAIIGTVAFVLLFMASLGNFLDVILEPPREIMNLLFSLVGPLGILIVGGLFLDMGKTVFDQEIRSIPILPFRQTPPVEGETKETLLYQGLTSTEKTNRFVSRFIAIVVTFLVVEFSTIAFQYQNRPDAGLDITSLLKAGIALLGAAVLLLMWSLFLKD